jgi:hypothetical protein
MKAIIEYVVDGCALTQPLAATLPTHLVTIHIACLTNQSHNTTFIALSINQSINQSIAIDRDQSQYIDTNLSLMHTACSTRQMTQ